MRKKEAVNPPIGDDDRTLDVEVAQNFPFAPLIGLLPGMRQFDQLSQWIDEAAPHTPDARSASSSPGSG
jgi:hypothetical protein